MGVGKGEGGKGGLAPSEMLLLKFFMKQCCLNEYLIDLSFVFLSLLRLTSLEYD